MTVTDICRESGIKTFTGFPGGITHKLSDQDNSDPVWESLARFVGRSLRVQISPLCAITSPFVRLGFLQSSEHE